MTRHELDRRRVLRGLGAACGLALTSPTTSAAVRMLAGPAPLDGIPRTLVLLQLSGGNDGLSTVVPYADEEYARMRGSLVIDPAEVRPLDERVGLHPNLARLHAQFDAGRVAVVQGVGYPGPNRSHFKSLDIWHAADELGRGAGDGWIGRLQQAMFGDVVETNRCIHVGSRPPYALHSAVHPSASFSIPAGYRWVHNDAMSGLAEGVSNKESSGNDVLDAIRGVAGDALVSSLAVRKAASAYRPVVDYPQTPLGQALRATAAVIDGEIGTRIVSVETGGFDTHDDQSGRHGQLMEDLDNALGSFLEDIDGTDVGRNTIVLAWSEFGRRVEPNASGGTDHGKAGPAFLLGRAVRGCVHGAHPSLEDLDDGDLRHAIDFRSLYGTVIEGWFGASQEDVLGKRYPVLPLLPA